MKITDDDIYSYIGALKQDITFLHKRLSTLESKTAPEEIKHPEIFYLWCAVFVLFLLVVAK